MANNRDFKTIAKARLKTVKILISANDWEGAAYMMGYVLECALKAAICKRLNLVTYPENTRNDKVDGYFMTHKFDQLLIPSGLTDLFSATGNRDEFRSWSDFTKEYPGEWPAMRYNPSRLSQFDEIKVKALYNCLTVTPHGIITVMNRKRRW